MRKSKRFFAMLLVFIIAFSVCSDEGRTFAGCIDSNYNDDINNDTIGISDNMPNDYATSDDSISSSGLFACNKRTIKEGGLEITGDIPDGVTAVVTQKTIEDVSAIVQLREKEGKNGNISALAGYDITLFDKNGKEWQPKTELKISVDNTAVDNAISRGESLAVYYLPEEESGVLKLFANEEPEEMPSDTENNELTFAVTHFSTYVVVSLTYLHAVTSIQTDTAYILCGALDVNNPKYITADIINNGGKPSGLKKTDNALNAADYYFEDAVDVGPDWYYILLYIYIHQC